jgi:c-di-AMP phosphodiesterase-like protein
LSKKQSKNEILELIQLVDSNFKFGYYELLLCREMRFLFIPFFALLILVWIIMVSEASKGITIILSIVLSFLAFVIALFSWLERSQNTYVVRVNYDRLSNGIEENKKPLLKALIIMKAKNEEYNLERIYKMNESMFTKEKLLEKLYE